MRFYPFVFTGEEHDEETSYGYCNDYQPHAVKRMFDYKNGMLYDMRWDEAGNLGQVSIAKPGEMFEAGRFLFWIEDSRMHAAVDDKHYSYYAYDYGGERRLKLVGVNSSVDVNAEYMTAASTLNEPTLYPSAYMVLTNKGYTKHYYAGTERVAARLGGGGLDAQQHLIVNDDDLQWKADRLFKQSLEHVNYRVLNENNLDCIMSNEFAKEEFGYWIDDIPYQMKADVKFDHDQFKDMVDSMLDDINHGQEKEVYFYHSDHLGSASWITDFSGVAVQHIQYLPYGEPYINQHPFGYSERFTFTGKERDKETGYGYFGARYMDHELMTMWLSVDPMADKYPGISPYAYCAWNPVKLVDPKGKDIYRLDVSTGSLKLYQKTKDKHDRIVAGSYQGIGRAKTFKETGKSILFSKGVLDGVKGKEYSKTGFTSSNGTQGQATSVAKFISFNCHRELSGAGFTTKNGSKELDVFAWSNNTYKSSDNPSNYSAPNNGQIEFHFHIHCGKSDGTMGNGTPSGSDFKFARTQASTYGEDNFYIISRHQGVTQYNQFGVIFSSVKEYHIPPALKRHQKK